LISEGIHPPHHVTSFSRYVFALSHGMIKTAFYQKVFSPVVPNVPKVSKNLLNKTVCVVGPGYVGLPLAQDFSGHIRTIGFLLPA